MLSGELDVLFNEKYYVKFAVAYAGDPPRSEITIQSASKEIPEEISQILLSINNEDETPMFNEITKNRRFSTTAHEGLLVPTIDAIRDAGIKISQIL